MKHSSGMVFQSLLYAVASAITCTAGSVSIGCVFIGLAGMANLAAGICKTIEDK